MAVTPAEFIMSGLTIEEAQYVIFINRRVELAYQKPWTGFPSDLR